MRSWISRWFWCSRVNWTLTISSPLASPQPQPCMNQAKIYHLVLASIYDRKKILSWSSALHESTKKIIIWSQPQYMTGKNIELNLSLEWIGWYFRLIVSVSALQKIFRTPSWSQSVSGGKRSKKSQSHWEFIFCQQYIQGWGKTKKTEKAKNGKILRKKCNFQPQTIKRQIVPLSGGGGRQFVPL